MPRLVSLLIIPIIFTFTFDHYFKIDDNLNIKIKDNGNKNINVHKNFDLTFNSSTINKFYSEKSIQIYEEEDTVKLKPKTKKNLSNQTQLVNLKILEKTNKSIQFISTDWKNNFTNKKIEFIETLLPLIINENNKILLSRNKLIRIKEILTLEKTLKDSDLEYIVNLSKKNNISIKNKHKIDLVNELLLNVNIIPNSIVLAQAANESGWGTSRFAKEYNALFGQYTYDKNSGIIPFQREKGKKHLIRNFSSIDKSVQSYFNNINSHYAYEVFRKRRSEINNFENDHNIKILTSSLDVYAEDEYYVNTINNIIDSSNLNQFNLIVNSLVSL